MDRNYNDPNDQLEPGFDRTDERISGASGGERVRRAADAALHDHDEPADLGDRVGEATGGVAGAATGAALGSLGGPIGTIIGGIAGAVGGWWAGRAVSEAAESFTDEDDRYYRRQFEQRRSGGALDPVSNLDPAGAYTSRATGESASAAGDDLDYDDYDRVRPAYQIGYLAGINPDYQGRSFDEVEPDLQRGWTNVGSGQGDWANVRDYARDAYSQGQQGQDRRITLSEEQLDIGKRQVQAGEVEIRKTVETEHVRETVPVTREELSVERRPLSADAATGADIGEDEIRIPLMQEEVVVDKRVVPKEEVVVKKHAVTEERVVADDVRRERLETDGLNDARVRGRSRDDARDELR
jgi:uncharacterized protein (TIGR02271 family)